jgi:4-hydroxyphenylpyruvate dioxygenase
MSDRGVEFLKIPDTYYENLRKGIENAGIKVEEDLDTIQRL